MVLNALKSPYIVPINVSYSLYCPMFWEKKDPLSWVEAQFNNLGEITEGNLQLRLIVSTCSSFYYETAKYLATYPTYSLLLRTKTSLKLPWLFQPS